MNTLTKITLAIVGLLMIGANISSSSVGITTDHDHPPGDYRHYRFEAQELTTPIDSCGGHIDYKLGWYHYHETPKC
jgi:hypothetical protein